MFWRDLFQRAFSDCEFEPPALEEAIAEVETALCVSIPPEMRALWREANGIRYGSGLSIWSTQAVIEQNLELRSYSDQNDLYMTFDSMLCFTDEGGGDLFFFPIQADGKINRPDVFVWEHETDSRKWVSPNLQDFVETCLQGKTPGVSK